MEKNLNKKNNSISKSNKLYNLFNDGNINIIPSRELMINKNSKTNKSKKNSKTTRSNKSNKYKKKKITLKRELGNLITNNNQFTDKEKYKCIGPCYPANTMYYHPISLQGIKNNFSSCPIKSVKIDGKQKIYENCSINNEFNYNDYDIFADIFQLASTEKLFLEQIYNIYNINDANLFIKNNLNELPTFSQKRIIESIYKVYRDNELFPSNEFLDIVQKILKINYDIDVKTNKILNKIMKNKHGKLWNTFFEKFNK